MKLSDLVKITDKDAKRVGRGHGSGKGKTSSRGYKGQKSRGKIKAGFEGGQLRLIKRLPFRRGVGNPSYRPDFVVINLDDLSSLPDNSVVDKELLLKTAILGQSKKNSKVKVLGVGDIDKPLTIKLPVSASAKSKIEKAGGKVDV